MSENKLITKDNPFDASEFVSNEVEHVEPPIAANKFSIDALIETSIPALFIKAKITNDPFTQGIYKTRWVKMLEKERDYLSGLDFSDMRESRLQRINAKLKDFREWANRGLAIEIQPLEPLTADGTAKPWLIPHPQDPEPEQPWYVPARFFARKLVLEDSTLLLKRDILAGKVAKSLDKVNIKKRGGKKPFNPGTIKKALSNINLG